MHLLLEDISKVLQALPEAQGREEEIFSVPQIKEANKERTGGNTSSMYRTSGRKEQLRRGAELRINCGINKR